MHGTIVFILYNGLHTFLHFGKSDGLDTTRVYVDVFVILKYQFHFQSCVTFKFQKFYPKDSKVSEKFRNSVNDSHLWVRFPRHFFHKLRKWGRCQLPVVVRSRRFGRNLASIWSCNLNVWFLVILGWGWMEIQDNSLVFIGDCGRWWRCGMVTAIFGFLCGNLIILLEIDICR